MDLESLGLRQVLDNLYDAVYVLDADRKIVLWNRAAERITGFTRAEVVGRSCRDGLLVHVDGQGCQMCSQRCPAAAAMRDGQAKEAEPFMRHRDGHRVPIRVRATPLLSADGQVIGAVEVFSDNTRERERRERLEQLERSALLDHLTELPNRRALDEELAARGARLERYERRFGLLMIDIDHFKRFNDTWGHDVGDLVLTMVARTLAATTRTGDVVGRWGGEEFLAILSVEDEEALRTAAERYRAMVGRSVLPGPDGTLAVTVSIGGSLARPGCSVEDALKEADVRLYDAKRAGRDRISSPSIPAVEI
jgi:diguanylate cyclase (GGDEF)-like protein/PAS domain S-box-containing protein